MSINVVVLSGRAVADPELHYTASGKAVCNGSIAVDDGWGDNQKTYFPEFVAWNKQAEFISQYVKKGMSVTIHGKYTENVWEDNDGRKRKKAVILVSEIVLPPKNSNTPDYGNSSATGKNTSSQSYANSSDDMFGEEIVFNDDDLPF